MYGVPMPIPKPYVMGMLIQCAGNPYTLDVREIGMLQNPIIAIWIFMSKEELIDIVSLLIFISRYMWSFTLFIFIVATQVAPWAHSGSEHDQLFRMPACTSPLSF